MWLVELYLDRCNELEDAIASESVSNNVDTLINLKESHEGELRRFINANKVCVLQIKVKTKSTFVSRKILISLRY